MAQLEMLKLEPDLDMYYCILESDEWSKADVHVFQNSAISSPSYPPLAATYWRSDMCTNLQSTGGKREMDTLCSKCGQTGHSSGSAKCPAKGTRCHFCQKLNHWEVVCQTKKQSQLVTGSDGCSQMNHIVPPKATQSAPPFLQTVQLITCAGKLMPFCAEVDMGSFCTIISRDYLSKYFQDKPVTALKELPCTYDHSPI